MSTGCSKERMRDQVKQDSLAVLFCVLVSTEVLHVTLEESGRPGTDVKTLRPVQFARSC